MLGSLIPCLIEKEDAVLDSVYRPMFFLPLMPKLANQKGNILRTIPCKVSSKAIVLTKIYIFKNIRSGVGIYSYMV